MLVLASIFSNSIFCCCTPPPPHSVAKVLQLKNNKINIDCQVQVVTVTIFVWLNLKPHWSTLIFKHIFIAISLHTMYSGTCLIWHTKGLGKGVGLYRMSEHSDFILVNRNTFGLYTFVGCHRMSENSGVGLHKFYCIFFCRKTNKKLLQVYYLYTYLFIM